MGLERIANGEVVAEGFAEAGHIVIAVLACVVGGMDAYAEVETDDEEVQVVAQTHTCAERYLVAEVLDAELAARLALALGETRIANERNTLYARLKAAFLKEFYTEEGRFRESTQTGAVLALRFGLTPEDRDLWALVVDSLLKEIEKKRAMHFSTGLLGTALLLPVLTEAEALDTAWQLLLQSSPPSWLYPVIRRETPPCIAWSAASRWLFETVCGIRPDFGARRFEIAPRFGRFLRYARARYDSVYGPVTSQWRREDEDFILDFTVPRGTEALVRGKLYGPGQFTLKIRHY